MQLCKLHLYLWLKYSNKFNYSDLKANYKKKYSNLYAEVACSLLDFSIICDLFFMVYIQLFLKNKFLC